jgi:hypothetical protein
LLIFSAFFCMQIRAAETPEAPWQPTTWNDEPALVSTSLGWRAIVSLARGRLIHFGPADGEVNLLLAPPTRSNPNLLGGHRLWLGPQAMWATIWPPPKSWELSGPESYTTDGGVLRMPMADAGDGWPRLTRTYHWEGARLVCGAEMHGGNRPAQFIQIFQVPSSTEITVSVQPDAAAPHGYVLLPSGPVTHFTADFSPPPHATLAGRLLTLRHRPGFILKIGCPPQTVTGRNGGFVLRVSRGTLTGTMADEPDRGFYTQIYLGGDTPLIELEQLSPLFAPKADATFTTVLEAVRL